ncbi:LysR substrate-binding domain protein [Bordetella bronchiseptica E014]|uniref:LysR family transcriptional regulator n=1 Tax=Bordetella bronchiseptica TaxID=518 RepID=UPI0004A06C1C|nr:LysR family transcriptional regulator [Bordetella bronchiseptica]KDC21141.1 LysR substrate-binding domain protein [Bordetella bronchiseptica E014]
MRAAVNLRSVDLNLLVFFDALMTERHVTRAADRIAVSQPAMSNALSRLRMVFKDELFVRTAKGMEPTPRALELGESVHATLQQAARLMTSDIQFDPSSTQRQFSLRMSDLVGTLVLPALMARVDAAAPGLAIDTVHLSPEQTIEALEADRLDLAVSMELQHTSAIRAEALFSDRMVCVLRKGHPLAGRRLTLKQFLAYRHVRVSMSPTDIRFVDSVLAGQGLRREVALNVTHWLLVPAVLRDTDLLAVMSERAAQRIAGPDTMIRPLPFATSGFQWTLYWHRRYEHSRAHQWLREQVRAVAPQGQGLSTPGAAG